MLIIKALANNSSLSRAEIKARQRLEDAQDVQSGRKTASQLRAENEHFGALAQLAKANLSASRSLG